MSYCSDVKVRLKGKRLAEIVEKLDKYAESQPKGYHENVAREFDRFEVLDVTPDNNDVYVELTYNYVRWYEDDVDEFMELIKDSEDYAYTRIGEGQGDVEVDFQGEIEPIYVRTIFDSTYDVKNKDEDEKRETDAEIYKNIFKC